MTTIPLADAHNRWHSADANNQPAASVAGGTLRSLCQHGTITLVKHCVFGLLIAISLSTIAADDFTTTTGKKYVNVTISRAEPDGLVVMTDSGVEKIPLSTLPKEVQTKYGYDPKKAAEFITVIHSAAAQQQMLTLSGAAGANFTTSANNNQITITGYSGSGGAVSIPSTINGLPVSNIGRGAFEYCTGLTSVTIPNSITSIGDIAFDSCKSLTSVTIPNSVTSIGGGAFMKCTSLTSVTIPNSVTSIGGGAFMECTSLTGVTIPSSVTGIGEAAFHSCTSLTSVMIPSSVTSIGEAAFDSCTGLTGVTIPNSVTSIGEAAFHSCKSLTGVTIPNSVTSIGKAAFDSCTGLTSVTIPNSVTSIGDNAFDGCKSLTSVTIPNSITSISGFAFARCTSLTSVTIPNSVTSIGEGAFFACKSLTSVMIPSSVTSVGWRAFDGCASLTATQQQTAGQRIGETRQQCQQRYGNIVGTDKDSLTFRKAGYLIVVHFFDNKADGILYGKIEVNALGKSVEMSDNEIEQLLKLNAGGRTWRKMEIISMDREWETEDGELVASYVGLEHVLGVTTKAYQERVKAVQKAKENKSLEGF